MTDAGNPWIDANRFAARRHLDSLLRETTPLHATTPLGAALPQEVAAAWAGLLRWPAGLAVSGEELVLCGSAREALGLALGGLLVPGDTVLVARPTATDALATVLGHGACYVDVGRCQDGAIDAAGAARAAERHPNCVVYCEAPSLTAEGDAQVWTAFANRARIADLRHAGWPTELPAADAVVLALRDPDQPGVPVLWAVAAREQVAATLGAIGGAGELPAGVLSRAAALLRSLAADPAWPIAAGQRLAGRAHPLRALATAHPGALLHAAGPLRVVASCAAGDAEVLASRWRTTAVAVAAYGDHPMRHLAVAELDVAGP